MKKLFLTYMILFLGIGTVVSQDKSLETAKTAYINRDYVLAIKHYKKAIRKSDNLDTQKDIAWHIANSYYNMNDYTGALEWFEDAMGNKLNTDEYYLKFSEALSIEGRYDEAISVLDLISSSSADSSFIRQKIFGIDLLKNNSHGDTLGIVRKEKDINSKYSDYGLAYCADKMVVSSARKEGISSGTDGRTGQGYSNLFFTIVNNNTSSWTKPKKVNGKFNTNENEGSFTYDSVNQIAYWTRCTEKSDLCLIYLSHFNSIKDSWTKPEKAGFQISAYNYGQPFVSEDGKTLLFTSNMPNGQGKNDIWKIGRKKDGSWGIPINLGNKINTEGDEAFPSIYGDTLLFFSSNHHKSLGKYDIFFSIKEGLNFNKISNIGYPINSAADDYAILLDKTKMNGWFCSDRDMETSDDIYAFKGFPIKIVIKGKVIHDLDNMPIAAASIVFTDENDISDSIVTNDKGEYTLYLGAFNDYRISCHKAKFYTEYKTVDTRSKDVLFTPPPQKTIDFHLTKTQYPCSIKGRIVNREDKRNMADVKVEIYNDKGYSNYGWSDYNGIYQFDGLKPNTIYTIRTSHEGYFTESRLCNLPKVNETKVFSRENGYDMDFELMRIQIKSEVILSNIYYDFNKSSLRATSKIELNKLASMLTETPRVIVQINAHTDEVGSPSYNLKLSTSRAQSVVDYLVMKGISRERLIAKGYGENNLLIKNAKNDEEHQANRRTTFEVVEILGSSTNKTKVAINEEMPEEIEASDIYEPIGQQQEIIVNKSLIYRIQIATTSKPQNTDSSFSKIKNNISDIHIIENQNAGLYKYEVGDKHKFEDAKILRDKLKSLGYNDCFIIAYYMGRKISVSEAVKLENK